MGNIEMYEGFPITFQNKNGEMMVNATQMTKAFGKKPKGWLRTQASKDFINAMTEARNLASSDLQQVNKLRNLDAADLQQVVIIEKPTNHHGSVGFSRWINSDP